MTVCVAAICEVGVIGASDRMLTAGDIQFEPQQTKIYQLTTSVAVMIAGDSALQAEILQYLYSEVKTRVEADPKKWLTIREVAEMYVRFYQQLRTKRAETAILAPLGLDSDSFLRRQKELAPEFVSQVGTELLNFDAPHVEAIVTGVDDDGPHIWVAHDGKLSCQDTVGFAAIGAGSWHADSQFMFAGHVRARPMPETLLLVYSAKKRAEVAPGVGAHTDMFMIGPSLGSYFAVGDHVLERLEEIYQATQKRAKEADLEARDKATQYVQEIADAATVKEQAAIPEDGGGNETVDQKESHVESKKIDGPATAS